MMPNSLNSATQGGQGYLAVGLSPPWPSLPAAQWWESLYLLLFSLCCQGLIWQLVLPEARVSLLAVPSHFSEVRRLYKQGGGFLFLLMTLPGPARNSSCHGSPRLCSQPLFHVAV